MTYVPAIHADPTNKIAMTGYQVQGTPGRDLLETGGAEIDGRHLSVAAQVEGYDFSAHADHEGLRGFIDAYDEATVIVNHGDRCTEFAAELRAAGVDASAPERGATATVGQ